jgi:hypothetical protein
MISHLKRVRRYSQLLRDNHIDYTALFADTAALVRDAQKLHGSVYLDRGYLKAEDLRLDGTIRAHEDPYQQRSHYFVVIKNDTKSTVAAARLIHGGDKPTHESFQTYTNLTLDKSGKKLIRQYDPSKSAEISGLVKARGENTIAVLMLYRLMWQTSISRGYRLWLMSCDVKLYTKLNFLFGNALTAIGPQQHYRGHEVIPCMLNIDQSTLALIHAVQSLNPLKRLLGRRLARFFLHDIPQKALRPEVLKKAQRLNLV